MLGKLIKHCQTLNDEEHFSIFINIAGHCNTISINVHPHGYKTKDDKHYVIDILNGKLPGYETRANMRLKDLRMAITTLTELSQSFNRLRIHRENTNGHAIRSHALHSYEKSN